MQMTGVMMIMRMFESRLERKMQEGRRRRRRRQQVLFVCSLLFRHDLCCSSSWDILSCHFFLCLNKNTNLLVLGEVPYFPSLFHGLLRKKCFSRSLRRSEKEKLKSCLLHYMFCVGSLFSFASSFLTYFFFPLILFLESLLLFFFFISIFSSRSLLFHPNLVLMMSEWCREKTKRTGTESKTSKVGEKRVSCLSN